MDKNIVLAGFGAAGKTTIGRYLAHRFDRLFIDVDEEISRRLGCHHDRLIQTQGWNAFRTFERDVVKDIATLENRVVATGGGTLLDPLNSVDLKKKGVIFYLDVPFHELKRRTRARLDRPVANAWTDEEMIKKYEERVPAYRSADVVVLMHRCNAEECADRLLEAIFDNGFPRIPYELWFRQTYKPLIKSQKITTALRPGLRLRPAEKGTFVGEISRIRILESAGTQTSLPQFDDYATTVVIRKIDVKTVQELRLEDLAGASPDAQTPEAARHHLGLTYNRIFYDEDIVSVINFIY